MLTYILISQEYFWMVDHGANLMGYLVLNGNEKRSKAADCIEN